MGQPFQTSVEPRPIIPHGSSQILTVKTNDHNHCPHLSRLNDHPHVSTLPTLNVPLQTNRLSAIHTKYSLGDRVKSIFMI